MARRAAIFAIGKPVAFDASAEERETRGFISMTTMRPVSGCVANCTLQPPVSTPTSRMMAMPRSRSFCISTSVSVSAGRHGDRVAGVHAHGVDVLDRADDHAVVVAVAHQLELELLPAEDRLLQEHLGGRRVVQAVAADAAQVLLVIGHAGAETAHGEAGTHHHRVPELLRARQQVIDRVADLRARRFAADALHDLLEQLAVLGLVDRVQARTDHLDAELLEGAVLGEGDRGVERRLAAEGGQQRVGTLVLR